MYVESITFDQTINDIFTKIRSNYDQTTDFINKNFLEIGLINGEIKNIKYDVNNIKNDLNEMKRNKFDVSEGLNNCTLNKQPDEFSGNLNNVKNNEKSFNYENTILSLSKRLCEIDSIIAELTKNYNSLQKGEDKVINQNIEKDKELINDMHINLGTTTQRFNKHEAEINEQIKEVIQTSIRNTIEIDEWEYKQNVIQRDITNNKIKLQAIEKSSSILINKRGTPSAILYNEDTLYIQQPVYNEIEKLMLQDNQKMNKNSTAISLSSGDAMVTGGYKNEQYLCETYILNFTKENCIGKHRKTDFNFKRCGHCSIEIKNNVQIMGGRASSEVSSAMDSVEKQSAERNEWQIVAPLLRKRFQFCCTKVADRYVIVIGGINETYTVDNSVERYDTNTNQWIFIEMKLDFWKLPFDMGCVNVNNNDIQLLAHNVMVKFTLQENCLGLLDTKLEEMPINIGQVTENKTFLQNNYIYVFDNNTQGEIYRFDLFTHKWESTQKQVGEKIHDFSFIF